MLFSVGGLSEEMVAGQRPGRGGGGGDRAGAVAGAAGAGAGQAWGEGRGGRLARQVDQTLEQPVAHANPRPW